MHKKVNFIGRYMESAHKRFLFLGFDVGLFHVTI